MEYGNRSAFLTHHRRRIAVLFGLLCLGMVGLTGRLVFLMMYRADHYSEMAQDLHQRERAIKGSQRTDPGRKRHGDRGKPHSLYHFRDPQSGNGFGHGHSQSV